MNSRIKLVLVLSMTLTLLASLMVFVEAQAEDFNLEAEQNWDTYGVGGTCIFGTHNIFVADVDGDGAIEIVTGGFTYNAESGVRLASQAPLKVWSWNDHNVTLEASVKWDGMIRSIYAADVDSDNVVEIITFGTTWNQTGNYGSLRIWHLNSGELSLQESSEGNVWGNSLFVSDVDLDGVLEILSVGRMQTETSNSTQLCIWRVQGGELTLDETTNLDVANVTIANSVYASDLDNDGTVEILIGGYSDTLSNSQGQLTVWQWNSTAFALVENKNWQTGGGTAKTIAGGTIWLSPSLSDLA